MDDLLARYQKVIEISRDLVSTLNFDKQLEKIVRAAADLCDAEAASILLYDNVRQTLFFQVATNMDEPFMRGLVVPMDSLAGWVVLNKKPVISGGKGKDEASSDQRHFGEVVDGFVTQSLLGVPILIQRISLGVLEEKIIGVLEVINKRHDNFNLQDQELIAALGAQAAVAIENTRLFQQSDFISEFVHELRAPLAALSNAAYILNKTERLENKDAHPSGELRERALQAILSESNYLFELSDNYLNLSRLESGRVKYQPNVFSVLGLLEECVTLMRAKAHDKRQSLSLTIDNDSMTLKADRSKIKQVIINLLNNAIKYTPASGSIDLSALAKSEEVIISIRDTGYGIPPESYQTVFEKYYRVPGAEKVAVGIGLGLAICKKIVEGHHGRIEVNSLWDKEAQKSNGTEISMFLPG